MADYPKKYWWLVLIVVPIAVAILGSLIGLIGGGNQPSPPPIQSTVLADSGKLAPLSARLKELYDETDRLRDRGLYSDALEKLNQIIAERPDYSKAYIRKGAIYLEKLKDYQSALEAFSRGLDVDSSNIYLLHNKGLAYYHLGDFLQALKWNEKALSRDPDFIKAIYASGVYHTALAEGSDFRPHFDAAETLYRNVIARKQDFSTEAMYNLAALYVRWADRLGSDSIKASRINLAIALLDSCIANEGVSRLKKVTGQETVPFGNYLRRLDKNPNYIAMIEKWKAQPGMTRD